MLYTADLGTEHRQMEEIKCKVANFFKTSQYYDKWHVYVILLDETKPLEISLKKIQV